MKIQFSAVDGRQDNAFSLEVDPAQFRGWRSAFGAHLQIHGLLEYDRTKVVPLEIAGTLAWHTDATFGLHVPAQPVGNGGSIALALPISDAQLASIEARRAGGEANLVMNLTALGRRALDGAATSFRMAGSPTPYIVPRDRWAEAIAACGVGRIRIVELLVPTESVSDAWSRSAEMLARASAEFAQGRHGESMGNARNALQEMVTVLESALAIVPKSLAFAPRVKELGERLSALHERRGADPYAVLASVIRAVFDFASDPVHRGFDVPNRDDAMFALSLATALYEFLSRRPLPNVSAEQRTDGSAKT